VTLVVSCEFCSLVSYLLVDVVDERVHDVHRFGRYSGLGMNLFEDLVDEARIRSEILFLFLGLDRRRRRRRRRRFSFCFFFFWHFGFGFSFGFLFRSFGCEFLWHDLGG